MQYASQIIETYSLMLNSYDMSLEICKYIQNQNNGLKNHAFYYILKLVFSLKQNERKDMHDFKDLS